MCRPAHACFASPLRARLVAPLPLACDAPPSPAVRFARDCSTRNQRRHQRSRATHRSPALVLGTHARYTKPLRPRIADAAHLGAPVRLGVRQEARLLLDRVVRLSNGRRAVEVDLGVCRTRRVNSHAVRVHVSTGQRARTRQCARRHARHTGVGSTLWVIALPKMRAHGLSPVLWRSCTGCSFSHARTMSHTKLLGALVLMATGDVCDCDTL